MIKFIGADGKLIGFGLSEENVKRLKDGMPIKINGEEVGLRGYVFTIFYGETEEKMAAELAPLLGKSP